MPVITLNAHVATNHNVLEVEAGTNCPAGGNASYGGRTVLRFKNQGGTNLKVSVDGGDYVETEDVSLVFSGDSEYHTVVECLEFAAKALKTQLAWNLASTRPEAFD